MQPWARIKNPTPLPARLHARALSRLDDTEFAALIRDNLMPQADDEAGKRLWRDLWQKLAEHEPLRERTVDLLDTWTEQADDELQGELDRIADRRVRKFLGKVDSQLRFLDAHPVGLTRHEASVVRQLVRAITAHRAILLGRGDATDPANRTLWVSLNAVGLDPDTGAPQMHPPVGYRGTLEWAGITGERYRDPTAIAVIDYLVQAIHRHRTAKVLRRGSVTGTDRVLWGILRAIRLDPQSTYTFRDGAPAAGTAEAPLGWAGPTVAELTAVDRMVLDRLVDAIATHRATTDPDDDIGHDRDLWEALDTVGLDPSSDATLTIPGHAASDDGVVVGMSSAGSAAATYLIRAIEEHQVAELDAEDLDTADLADDDPCAVLWSVLDRMPIDQRRT